MPNWDSHAFFLLLTCAVTSVAHQNTSEWQPAQILLPFTHCDVDVESVDMITAKEFIERYVDAKRPVLLRGGIQHWPRSLWRKRDLNDTFEKVRLKIKPTNKPAYNRPVSAVGGATMTWR